MRVFNNLAFGEINLVCVASSLLSVHLSYVLEFFTVESSELLVSGDLDGKLLPENRISNIMMIFCVDVMQWSFFFLLQVTCEINYTYVKAG